MSETHIGADRNSISLIVNIGNWILRTSHLRRKARPADTPQQQIGQLAVDPAICIWKQIIL